MIDNPLRSDADYEFFIYSIAESFQSIARSTLTFVRQGATLARVAGELHFADGYRIVVRERIVYDRLPAQIDWYGYEVWRHGEKLFGMTHNLIHTNRHCKARILIINMCRRI